MKNYLLEQNVNGEVCNRQPIITHKTLIQNNKIT